MLASEVRELMGPLLGLYTDDGTEGGAAALYMSEETLEYTDGTCWWEKLRKGTLGGGALGPVELLFLPWYGPRGMLGGLADSGTGLSNPASEGSPGMGSFCVAYRLAMTGLTLPLAKRTESWTRLRRSVAPCKRDSCSSIGGGRGGGMDPISGIGEPECARNDNAVNHK